MNRINRIPIIYARQQRFVSSHISSHSFILHGNTGSQPCRSILMLCYAQNIPFEMKSVHAVNLQTKSLVMETRSKEFLAMNPTGQVPVIEDKDIGVLAESGAILQYIAEKNQLEQWYPKDTRIRAKINFWLHWNHSNTRNGTMGILVGVLFPKIFGAGLEAGRKKYERAISFLESSLVPGKFVAGTDQPTIADLALVVECDQLSSRAFGLFDFTSYPKVNAWMKAVEESIPSYNRVFDPVVVAAHTA